MREIFEPESVAVIGASKNTLSWGARLFAHLIIGGFLGKIYPVNPKEEKIFGYECMKNVPEVDLAVICIPSTAIPEMMEECCEAGVKASVIITSGFGETGEKGKKLEDEVLRIARDGGIRLVGPNCMGVISTPSSLNVSITPVFPERGNISIISQSGTTGHAIIELLTPRGISFSRYVSTGNEADLGFEDYLEWMNEDDSTKVILGFMEGVREGKKFLSIAEKLEKPFVLLKVGSTLSGKLAAVSHTGALAGDDDVWDAVFCKFGIKRVSSIGELMDLGSALAIQPPPKGKRICVLTAGGGAGVLSADLCEKYGLELAELPEKTIKKLDRFLPPFWSRRNPVDMTTAVIGDITAHVRAIKTVLECENVDCVLLLVALGMLSLNTRRYEERGIPDSLRGIIPDPRMVGALEEHLAKQVVNLSRKYGKPVLSVNPWVSLSLVDEKVARITKILSKGGILSFPSPEDAIRAYARCLK